MAISMYQVSIPRFIHTLTVLGNLLDKAQAYETAKKLDPSALPNARLFIDMLPLTSQVQIACDGAKGAACRLSGVTNPTFEDNEKTLPELKARVEKTIAFLKTFKPEQIDGTEDKELIVKVGGNDTKFGGMQFLLGRSILTEKLARRGHHITREYSIDPFELVRVRDVMDDLVPMVPGKLTLAEFATRLNEDPDLSRRQGTVVVDERGRLTGMITRGDLFRAMRESEPARRTVAETCSTNVVVAYPEDSLHAAVMKMLDRGVGRLPVVEPENPDRVVGYLGRAEVLAARSRLLEEEHVREASGPVWGWGVGRRELKQS